MTPRKLKSPRDSLRRYLILVTSPNGDTRKYSVAGLVAGCEILQRIFELISLQDVVQVIRVPIQIQPAVNVNSAPVGTYNNMDMFYLQDVVLDTTVSTQIQSAVNVSPAL